MTKTRPCTDEETIDFLKENEKIEDFIDKIDLLFFDDDKKVIEQGEVIESFKYVDKNTGKQSTVTQVKYVDKQGKKVKGYFVEQGGQYRIVNKNQSTAFKEYLKEKERFEARQYRIEQDRGKHFIKCFVLSLLSVEITPADAGKLLDLIMTLRMNCNKLTKGGKNMSKADLAVHLGYKGKREKAAEKAGPFINRMVALGVVNEQSTGNGKQKTYSINKDFHMMGASIEKDLEFVKIYKKKYAELTEGLNDAEKGIIYKIIPYFHINLYVLCANPTEPDASKIKSFNKKQLAEAINVDAKVIQRTFKKLKDNGILGEFDTFGFKAIYVHPDLIWRKDYDDNESYTDAVRKVFEVSRTLKNQ